MTLPRVRETYPIYHSKFSKVDLIIIILFSVKTDGLEVEVEVLNNQSEIITIFYKHF